MARQRSDFLNGVPELLILRLLSDHPMYGYELVQSIRASTGAELSFGEGCIYPILHRLEDAGELTSRRETVSGRSRVVYRITASGKRKLAQVTADWRRIAAAISQALGGANVRPELA